ncbi:MAG: hypothetical protein WC810_03065 [Janthinobacterium sp.]|jgi:hypothetical protein
MTDENGNTSNNGHEEVKETKTPVELKAEAFAANPDDFVNIADLVIAIKRSDKGPMVLLAPQSRQEMIMALGEIQAALFKAILKYDLSAEALREQDKKIKPATGSMINHARKIFGGR